MSVHFTGVEGMSQRLVLNIPGKPQPKERPRFNTKTGNVYTPNATVAFQYNVGKAWEDNGSLRFMGPIRVKVTHHIRRPNDHFTSKGSFTKKAQRSPFPTKQPDVDNVVKAITDALEKKAYHNDSQIVRMVVSKEWGEHDYVTIIVEEMPNPLVEGYSQLDGFKQLPV